MRPVAPRRNHRYGGPGYPKRISNGCMGSTCFELIQNLHHLFFREFATRYAFPFGHSPSQDRVLYVVELRTEFQMRGVAAPSVVALMPNHNVRRKLMNVEIVTQAPSVSVSEHTATGGLGLESAVKPNASAATHRALPGPAAVYFRLIYFQPKALSVRPENTTIGGYSHAALRCVFSAFLTQR